MHGMPVETLAGRRYEVEEVRVLPCGNAEVAQSASEVRLFRGERHVREQPQRLDEAFIRARAAQVLICRISSGRDDRV